MIRLSTDPLDNNVIWIDEFEVVRNYRMQGIGKSIICEFLEDCDNDVVKLMAKNEKALKFWEKCGFQYEYKSWDEIRMIHSKQSRTL